MNNKGGNSLTFTCAFTFVVAACSLLYELLIAQTVAHLAANTVVWYSVTIGTYLCAMGLGAFLANRVFKGPSRWHSLFTVEILLSLAGILIVPLIHFGHITYSSLYMEDVTGSSIPAYVFFGTAFLIASVVGMLSGLELPLLIAAGKESSSAPYTTNRVLTADYVGSLAAGLLFPMVLVPHVGLVSIGILIATLNLVMAGLILWRLKKSEPILLRGALTTVLLGLSCFAFANVKPVQQFFLQKYYYYMLSEPGFAGIFSRPEGARNVERWSSPYQKIDLVHDDTSSDNPAIINSFSNKFIAEPDFPRDRFLFLNGDFQFASNSEEIYHEYFAHLPMIINGGVPESILVLGGGDGLLIRELVKHKTVRRIVHVDLDRKLVELAKEHPVLLSMNKKALFDPRVEEIFGDGFTWIRNTDQTFDAIYIDFPYAVDYNLSKLYSREFYHFVSRRLKPNGFTAVDTPGVGMLSDPAPDGTQVLLPDNDWSIYYHTMKAAGFKSIIPYVTTLDINDPQIYENLSPLVSLADLPELPADAGDPAEAEAYFKNMMIRDALVQYMVSLQQGFIYLSNRKDVATGQYIELPVQRYVLNEKHYHLAFATSFPKGNKVNLNKVNSIMKPRFPTLPLTYVRLPF
ncbi:MAG: hypothetical protein J5J00_01945 [Deltaproteobacteria bacterium]|nr:hypothetical protein [Deltaproteobacteria bacterium]